MSTYSVNSGSVEAVRHLPVRARASKPSRAVTKTTSLQSADGPALLNALSSVPWAVELAANDPILKAVLRGLERRKKMLDDAGGSYTTAKVARILNLSIPTVRIRRAANQLLAVRQDKWGYSYPRFQFDKGKPLAGLRDVLESLKALDPWMQLNFFTSPHEHLDGLTPIQALRAGRVQEVTAAASVYGEQGAA